MSVNQYYKYRPLYDLSAAQKRIPHPFTEKIFTKAEIYFSAPSAFNDPYDCNLRLHVNDSTDAEWESFIDDLIKTHPMQAEQVVNLQKVKSARLWKSIQSLTEDIGKSQEKQNYEDSSVFCLAKRGNSIPMFSYYADGHTGIAIEFSFSDQNVPCGFTYSKRDAHGKPFEGRTIVYRDVEYPATFPELNFHRLRNSDKLVRHLLFTKSPEWQHEQEFRIFRRKVPKGTVAFDRQLVTRVVFGCKTTTAEVSLVKGWLKGWPTDVILSKAERSTDRFELKVSDFDLVKGT